MSQKQARILYTFDHIHKFDVRLATSNVACAKDDKHQNTNECFIKQCDIGFLVGIDQLFDAIPWDADALALTWINTIVVLLKKC